MECSARSVIPQAVGGNLNLEVKRRLALSAPPLDQVARPSRMAGLRWLIGVRNLPRHGRIYATSWQIFSA